MKKFIVIVVVIIIIAAIIGILLMNKSKREQKLSRSEIQTSLPVLVESAKEEKIIDTLSLVGTTAPFNEVIVSSETAGKVLGLYFDVGTSVGKGRTLVRLDDEVKRATLDNAEANYEKAKKDFERYELLLSTQSITEAQYEQAKLVYKQTEAALRIAERQLRDSRIVSPISGVVTTRNIEVGTYLNTGNQVATIVNISRLKVRVYVPELEAFKLKNGDEVEITTEVYPGKTFTGNISSINAKADDAHTYLVEINLDNNKANPLKAGLFARVYFTTLETLTALVIPRSAILGSVRDAKVYVVDNNNIARLKNITVGAEFGNRIEVIDGISNGDLVVTSGQVNLRDSSSVVISK